MVMGVAQGSLIQLPGVSSSNLNAFWADCLVEAKTEPGLDGIPLPTSASFRGPDSPFVLSTLTKLGMGRVPAFLRSQSRFGA